MSDLILIEILSPVMGFVRPYHSFHGLAMRRCPIVANGEELLWLQLEVDKVKSALGLQPFLLSAILSPSQDIGFFLSSNGYQDK